MKVFLATFAVYILSVLLAGLFGNSFPGFGVVLFFIGWGFCIAYLFATAKEFLCYLYDPEYEPPTEASRQLSEKSISDEVNAMGSGLIRSLNRWKKEIESEQIQRDMDELITLCQVVMQRNDEESKKFYERYTDTLNHMLSKYDEIENTRINSPEMLRSMELIEKSITEIVVVFRNEINKMYKNDLLHLNAGTKAFMQDLRNKGLIE
ncbi:MAG: 5-bromo-4-chloroindolyl phosphate hydrolysis family protein [Bacteroides sp.]|nr:5-bromo-4-chloroindolyl phosphate hydrolysis family protein [Bacteroides sp.]